VLTERLKPYPAEVPIADKWHDPPAGVNSFSSLWQIFQRESQLVLYHDSHYVPSPYPTQSQVGAPSLREGVTGALCEGGKWYLACADHHHQVPKHVGRGLLQAPTVFPFWVNTDSGALWRCTRRHDVSREASCA
jgi:hypothetical protein